MNSIRGKRSVVLIALGLCLVLCITLAASQGSVTISPDTVAAIIASRVMRLSSTPIWKAAEEAIIWDIRLPRVLTAVIVGAALSVAGVIFQGLLRNPMADPYIIGTSGGAALGATIAMLLPVGRTWLGFTPIPVFAFTGALLAVLAVYNIARVGPATPITTLLLSGFALSSMMAALMSFLMLLSGDALRKVVLWTMGGVSTAGWVPLTIVIPLVMLGMLMAYGMARDLNAFLLGEEQAAYLGVRVEQRKLALLMVGSLLTGAAVSVSGLVGFVGLVVPHAARLILGPDHRLLLPASALLGGSFLVLADLIARMLLSPTELPVGVVTAMMGAPFFIYLLRRSKKEYNF
ncbi:MAG: iron chelate uptake ABC transporter family permease subunit [Chloroflexi bacterium]|nr:iron chelate uptake ABC transporter family permease subunit [Chloroflexota bacterium]